MMNLRKIKWWKVVLMTVLTAFFLYFSISGIEMLRHDYGTWIVNESNVQERAYEALSMLHVAGALLVMFVSLFIASLRSLIHCFFPLKKPSIFARLAIRHGWRPALICFIVFLALLAFEIILVNIINSTPEVNEAPATLFERKISGWNGIAMLLALEATIVMFVSWLQNRAKKNHF